MKLIDEELEAFDGDANALLALRKGQLSRWMDAKGVSAKRKSEMIAILERDVRRAQRAVNALKDSHTVPIET